MPVPKEADVMVPSPVGYQAAEKKAHGAVSRAGTAFTGSPVETR